MKKILIVTNVNDLSISLFLTQKIQEIIDVDFYFFYEGSEDLKKKLVSNTYDFIYFGYPFRETDAKSLESLFNVITKHAKDAYIIDNLTKLDDLYFEDKWIQYQIFSQFMPETKLLSNIEEADKPLHITKERVSGRAEGVYFNSKELKKDNVKNYIIQEILNIKKEYRIYVVCNEIITTATIKSSKTQNTQVRVIGTEDISPEMIDFVTKVIKKNTFDFIGLDIAESANGFHLIEINRACLFNGHFKQTGVNLAENLIKSLLNKNIQKMSI